MQRKYFRGRKTLASLLIQGFLILLFVFSVVFFLWSLMKYNKIMEDKKEDEAYIEQLNDEIERLEYLVDAPLDPTISSGKTAQRLLHACWTSPRPTVSTGWGRSARNIPT